MSLFQWVGLPWNLLLSLAAMVSAGMLIIDADWMWKLTRGRNLPAPPPLFGGIVAAANMRPKALYFAIFGFVLVPMLMTRVVGLPARATNETMLWLGACAFIVLALLLAQLRGWTWLGNGLAALLCALLLFPYAAAGWHGVQRYLTVEGLFWLIAAILYFGIVAHRLILGHAPRTRAGQWARLIATSIGAVAIMAGTFWPWIASG